MPSSEKIPWIETPLVRSKQLSEIAGCNVFLKLDNLQPSGSFKSRGVGNYIRAALRRHQSVRRNGQNTTEDNTTGSPVHFYSSSGGNAGLAAVHAAVTLDCPATVVVPKSTTAFMIDKIRAAGAIDVIQCGDTWAEADKYLRDVVMEEAKHSSTGTVTPIYVPPFDAPNVWNGNATIVEEILRQLQSVDRHYALSGETGDDEQVNGTVKNHDDSLRILPDLVICSVGGGGLFSGICQGIDSAGLSSRTKLLAVETLGADSLSQSVKAEKLITLPGITSIATSLGARTVCSKALEYALRDDMQVLSHVATDAAAVEAMGRFADEQRILVEAACGVCFAPIYDGSLRRLVPDLKPDSNVVVEVCGGSNISLDILAGYVKRFGLERA